MQRQTVLIVDDEQHILELLRYNLSEAGYETLLAANGETALDMVQKKRPDLILLDIMLPGIDGLEVCRRLKGRGETAAIPIIMLTARGDELDKVLGLEIGADDYIVKPFSVREVQARVKAMLRRQSFLDAEDKEPAERIELGALRLEPASYSVYLDGEKLPFTLKEFALLQQLIVNRGRVLSRNELLDRAWGYEYFGETRTVDVHIRHVRKKLGKLGECIQTMRGIGYILEEPEA